MRKHFFTFIISCIFIFPVHAQEGMWMLTQIDQLNLAQKGLQIPVGDIYSPGKPGISRAVLQLGGGSASFISPDGLVITNHHVAYTALQRVSSASSDFITNGFLAKTRPEEIQAPGYQARMLLEMKDVTAEVLDAGKGISDPVEKDKKINKKIEEMTESLKNGRDDVEVRIVQMFNGKQYVEFISKVFKDIRIVYSPPLSIGNYGGEIDNWMWPRHTGDFSFMRVYVSPEGKGTAYDKSNVPYKPEIWLKVAKENLKPGEFNFIVGYPGATTRYRTSTSVHWNQEYNYPFAINNFREIISLMDELTKNDPEGKIKVASLKKGLANAMKNYEGKVEGMKKTNYLQKKIGFENEFMQWVNSNPATKNKYGDILAQEKDEYVPLEKTRERDNVLGVFQGLASTQLGIASTAYYLAREMEKPETERQPGLTDEAIQNTIDGLQYNYANYFEPVDKAMLVRALKMDKALPSGQRITGLEYIVNDPSKTIEQFADEAFKSSKLNDLEFAKTLFKKSPKELEALNDPFIEIAIKLSPVTEEVQKTNQEFASKVIAIRKIYMDALYEWKGKSMYPDANSTCRFTWGPVKGYRPADAVWYDPFTTLTGVIEKNTGIEPFDAPEGLIKLYEKKDYGKWMDPVLKDVPVAFLNQCDITGGNSGSPVMNGKGEIVGVAFDGNYEAMISDWQYDYAMQRCIAVDIHYVLFITEKFGKAGFLLDEMRVSR